ncbi:MAG: hypothetical protein Q4E18_00870 [Clostridia bacterium]|nr:hypothetical protein [Clostridia bacterium]
MKLKKMIAAIVVGVMAWMTVGTAMALVKDGVVSPMYAHTRRVETALVISESGYAECRGYVRSNKSDDSITMTLTLYQKAGKGWKRVAGWSDSIEGWMQLEIKKYRSLEKGTYQLILDAKVTTSEGESETVSKVSNAVTYS